MWSWLNVDFTGLSGFFFGHFFMTCHWFKACVRQFIYINNYILQQMIWLSFLINELE